MKENAENHKTETQLQGAIDSCKHAITVLSKHNPDFAQIRAVVQRLGSLSERYVAESSLSGNQIVTFKGFLQKGATATSFLSIPGMQSYGSQSGQIFGILKQMKEDFEKDLKELQDDEAKAVEEFNSLKGAKEGEMAAGTKQIEQADADLAEFAEKHAQAEEQLADTEEQVAKDKEFLANLKKKCAAADKEYQERTKARLEEIQGVTDTIGFLNSDEAHAMFGNTTNTAFVQKKAVKKADSVSFERAEMKMRRAKVVKSLEALAERSQSPRIVMLVTAAHLDAFTKVKAEIDKMIAELKTQQADEVKERDFCIKELNKNNLTLEEKYDEQANLISKEEDLTATIEQLTKSIKEKKAEIKDMQTQMKRDSEDREAENADFQQTAADQRVTQMILSKALDRMKQVYALLQKRAPHIQTSATDTDPGNGPARFGKYEQNAGGNKVITMIEEVIAESKKTEAEAIAGEQDSQQAYENFMKDSNDSIMEYTKAITNMSADLGKAKEELVMTKEALAANSVELQDLHDTEASLHKSCDYLLKNFETRQAARLNEIDGLNEAKAILSGA